MQPNHRIRCGVGAVGVCTNQARRQSQHGPAAQTANWYMIPVRCATQQLCGLMMMACPCLISAMYGYACIGAQHNILVCPHTRTLCVHAHARACTRIYACTHILHCKPGRQPCIHDAPTTCNAIPVEHTSAACASTFHLCCWQAIS